MYNTTTQQQQNQSLDDLFRSMQETFDSMEATLHSMFNDPQTLSEYQKKRIADEYLKDAGFDGRGDATYKQWGIYDCENADQIRVILDDYLEYRRDKAAGIL